MPTRTTNNAPPSAPKHYTVSNTIGGGVVWTGEAATEADALDAMARAAGYDDFAHAQEAAPVDAGELIVRAVQS